MPKIDFSKTGENTYFKTHNRLFFGYFFNRRPIWEPLLNTITKFQSMEWKKQEWPGCADLAISYIHAQCQKFSQSGVPSPAQLTSLIEIIDEFIFR